MSPFLNVVAWGEANAIAAGLSTEPSGAGYFATFLRLRLAITLNASTAAEKAIAK